MRYQTMRLCCLLLIFGGLWNPVDAETSQERVALSLAGPDCSSQRQSIGTALAQILGVSQVDLESVPDHVLVDVAGEAVIPEALSSAATAGMTTGAQCLVEIMKSCISASLSPAHR